MRALPHLTCGVVMLCAIFGVSSAFACDAVPAGQALWIRLAAPVSTYTAKPGDTVRAILTQDLICGDDVIVPMGTPIEGYVLKRHKVGWGFRHETASLELEFTKADVAPGVTVQLDARVDEVENARETVHDGVIHGIRSSNTFQGSIDSRLIHLPTWNPYSDPILITYKAVFPIFPEPEIFYPTGTDMRLKTTKEIVAPVRIEDEDPARSQGDSDQTVELVQHLPERVMTKKHVSADVVNLVFSGSEAQLEEAFHEAGWSNADQASKRSALKNLYALLNNSGYAQQPMTTFLLDGKPEDMNWQKGLNSYGRRDHVRIWKWQAADEADPVWVATSTHDTEAVLSLRYQGFVHHIAPEIDDERTTVIRDLRFAGCVKQVSYIARTDMPNVTMNATGDVMHTDGSVAVVELQDCRPMNPGLQSTARNDDFKPGNIVFRYLRKQILTFRNDVWRENIIYGTYEVGRMTVMSLRHRTDVERLRTALYADAETQAKLRQAALPTGTR